MPPGVPDHPTAGRWCKGCSSFLPIESFPPGRRRYQCRLHTCPQARERKERLFARNPSKKALWRMWHYSYLDSRSAFRTGGEKCTYQLVQDDILELCQNAGVQPSSQLRVVPMDPRKPLEAGRNGAIVSRRGRALLAKIWKVSCDTEMYASALARLQTWGSALEAPVVAAG